MSKKILFVIDMQNDFIDGTLGSEEAKKIVPNVVNLINTFHKDNPNDMIFYTLDTHYENYLDTLEGKKLPIKHCIKNTPGHDLNIDIQRTIANNLHLSKCFDKETFGSLNMISEAANYLWENPKSDDEIYICGLVTNICVLHNFCLLRAQFPNLNIYCYKNCCAGTSKEAHEMALRMMKDSGAIIL